MGCKKSNLSFVFIVGYGSFTLFGSNPFQGGDTAREGMICEQTLFCFLSETEKQLFGIIFFS
jgi:hypothetical protein